MNFFLIEYFPILIFLMISILLSCIVFGLSYVLGRQIGDVEKLYEDLTALIAVDQLKDDWYEDTDNDLKDRVAKFMAAFGYKEIADVGWLS